MKIFKFNLQRFVDLTNTSGNKSLAGTNDADNITNSGNVVTISAGEGRDTVSNSGNIVQIFAGVGHDSVKNTGNNVTIDSGEGNDTVRNEGDSSSVAVALGSGNDYLYIARGLHNEVGNYLTITGGVGKDSIYTYNNGRGSSDHSYIDLGDDDD